MSNMAAVLSFNPWVRSTQAAKRSLFSCLIWAMLRTKEASSTNCSNFRSSVKSKCHLEELIKNRKSEKLTLRQFFRWFRQSNLYYKAWAIFEVWCRLSYSATCSSRPRSCSFGKNWQKCRLFEGLDKISDFIKTVKNSSDLILALISTQLVFLAFIVTLTSNTSMPSYDAIYEDIRTLWCHYLVLNNPMLELLSWRHRPYTCITLSKSDLCYL